MTLEEIAALAFVGTMAKFPRIDPKTTAVIAYEYAEAFIKHRDSRVVLDKEAQIAPVSPKTRIETKGVQNKWQNGTRRT